jgi:acyl-CoA reductase-like NAD-dependent aldehyde dehydrogenase
MELSGCDAVFVRRGADLDLVARSLAFGLAFNGGRTCVAPRRVFVARPDAEGLCDRLVPLVERLDPVVPGAALLAKADRLISDAAARGARCLTGGVDRIAFRPAVVGGVRTDMPLVQADLFVPLLSVIPVEDDEHALRLNDRCPFALGAVVFGEAADARELATRIPAGVVVVNDVIVPHADPRLPFGGLRASGFGTTRGAEGLLEMTRPKAIVVRGGRFRPHLDPARPDDAAVFADYLTAAHGATLPERFAAGIRVVRGLMRRPRTPLDNEIKPVEKQ